MQRTTKKIEPDQFSLTKKKQKKQRISTFTKIKHQLKEICKSMSP